MHGEGAADERGSGRGRDERVRRVAGSGSAAGERRRHGYPDMGSLPLLVAARGSGRVEDQEPAEMDSEAHPEGGAGAAGRRAVTGQQGARRHQALVRSQLPGQTW